jgi:prephenate dehydratase
VKIAYLGPPGTFSEQAALLCRAEEDELLPLASFPAVVSAVETGAAQLAVLAIENSIEGSVNANLDLLIHETALKICREVVVPVHHFLVGVPGADVATIRDVHSHPQAFGQCRGFLTTVLPGAREHAALSTAGAVEDIVRTGDRHVAAIGPELAARIYGGEILARNIEDNHNNVTRFVALAAEDQPPTGTDKTSLCLSVRANEPGALYEILGELAVDKIQMTKLESRPAKGLLGEYFFLIDIEGHRLDQPIAEVLERMRAKADVFQIWGSYPRFQAEQTQP